MKTATNRTPALPALLALCLLLGACDTINRRPAVDLAQPLYVRPQPIGMTSTSRPEPSR